MRTGGRQKFCRPPVRIDLHLILSEPIFLRSFFIYRLCKPGQTHQNYSDKNCNISNCKALIINALDLFMLDIFRIFIV